MPIRPLVLLSLAALLGCGGGSAAAPDDPGDPPGLPATTYYPPLAGTGWETIAPAALGWDTVALDAALDWAGTQNTSAVVILWRGRLVAERYWNGWGTTTAGPWFSAGKTVTGCLVGQLAAEGLLELGAPAATYLGAGWSRAPGTEAQVTVRHLLSMASGLDDSLEFVVAPGARFYYNNPAYYQLFAVLEGASGEGIATLSRARLWDRIGMGTVRLIPNVDTGEPGWIHYGSARDFARFGLMVLNHGMWNGTRVADSTFLAQSRRPSGTDNDSYGWLWWLNGRDSYRTPGPYLLPTYDGPLFPEAPADLAAALGKDDKKLYVVPSLELVVVRLGDRAPVSGSVSPAAVSTFDNEFWRWLRPAIGY